MPKHLPALLLSATLLGTSSGAALAFGFDAPVNQCIVDPEPECFDILFAELSKRVDALIDARGYAPIPAAILLKAERPRRAEIAIAKIKDPARRKEMLVYIGNAYARAGQIDDAYRILKDIKAPQIRAILIATIASVQLRDGDIESTLAPIIELMDVEFIDPTLSDIARMLADSGHLHRASRIAEAIFDARLQAHALGHVSRGFAKAGDVAMAVAHARLIRDRGLQVLVRGEVGFTLHQRGYKAEAMQLYRDAAALVSALKPDDPARDERLESIAHYLIKSGHATAAVALIDRINAPGTRGNLYQRLGHFHAVQGEKEAALRYLGAAVSAASGEKDQYRRYSILREAAMSFAKVGAVDAALSVAQSIQDANIRGGTIKTIGNVLLENGDIARAEQIYLSIDQMDLRAVAVIGFAGFLEAAGQGEEADAHLQALEAALRDAPVRASDMQDGQYLRGSSLASLSRAYSDRGNLKGSLRVALTLEKPDQRLWTLIPIFGAAMDAGDHALADRLNDILFAELKAHPNPRNTLSLIIFLTTFPTNLENIELHRTYAGLLPDDRSKSLLFSAIFEALTQSENYRLAVPVQQLIPEQPLREVATIDLLKRKIESITESH